MPSASSASGSDGFTGPELVAWMSENGWTGRGLAAAARCAQASVWRWRAGGCSYIVTRGIMSLGTRVKN